MCKTTCNMPSKGKGMQDLTFFNIPLHEGLVILPIKLFGII